MNRWRMVYSLAALVLLAGCSHSESTQGTQEYLLSVSRSVPAIQNASPQTGAIQLLAIQLPDYLDGNQMIIVSPQGQVYRSRQHLWAEPLASQLRRLTQTRLAERLPQINWFVAGKDQPRAQLQIECTQFMTDTQGNVHISGYWQLLSSHHERQSRHAFQISAPLAHSGYLAMSQTLSQSWLKIVDKMAQILAHSSVMN
ncbi:PqiC family protein [Celerinatantimonas yamalensis]|uniref:ABC-type transport auxiliary lipoprotein family protein n=1 Tax=Celerinatantimonas yamalensis TaxID=559956 RepID=A0ABW9G483_9GAMM